MIKESIAFRVFMDAIEYLAEFFVVVKVVFGGECGGLRDNV